MMKDQYGNEVFCVGQGPVVVNPGTGDIKNTTEKNAVFNMQHYIIDCNVAGLSFERVPDRDYGGGRYAFILRREGYEQECEIQMPGVPIENVRFLGKKNQHIWEYPRLYIDGSSYVWCYCMPKESYWEKYLP